MPAGKSLVRITISPEPLLILLSKALLSSSSLGPDVTTTLALSVAGALAVGVAAAAGAGACGSLPKAEILKRVIAKANGNLRNAVIGAPR